MSVLGVDWHVIIHDFKLCYVFEESWYGAGGTEGNKWDGMDWDGMDWDGMIGLYHIP